MLSKSKKKFIRSLEHKKYRNESQCFIAEGNKLVADLMPYFECELLLTRPSWLATQGDVKVEELIIAEKGDIESVSLQKSPQDVLAVFKQIEHRLDINSIQKKLTLVLDGIQDPGNLGTIVRIADWFGIEFIICSLDTADIYNPKVVQSTMGSLSRVKIVYTDLIVFFKEINNLPVYGTFLSGNNIYEQKLSQEGLIVMGNEGNGIRKELEPFVTHKLYIPTYSQSKELDSLNVAIATAITCSEFKRG